LGGWNPSRRTPQDLDVTEGGRERLKGRELVGIDLCHAAEGADS
jgi:hypothetical protein